MAQVSRSTFATSLSTKINDNTAGEISAQDVREIFTDLEDSATWYDEVPVQSVNSATGTVVLDADDIDDTSTTHKFATAAELSKLAGIETGADVTDAANVETAIEAITYTNVTPATGDKYLVIDATDGGLKAVLNESLPSGIAWSTAVNADIVPDADGTRDLGTTVNRFAELHVDTIDLNGSTITATATKTAPSGDVVGTTDTQTLTNKTLTSPKSSYTSHNAGTKSSGTYTPAYTDGNMQYAVNGGAHTLAPQTGDGVIIIHYTNNGTAGTITTSGFTAVKGDSLTTTDTHEFILTSVVINSNSVLTVQALQ